MCSGGARRARPLDRHFVSCVEITAVCSALGGTEESGGHAASDAAEGKQRPRIRNGAMRIATSRARSAKKNMRERIVSAAGHISPPESRQRLTPSAIVDDAISFRIGDSFGLGNHHNVCPSSCSNWRSILPTIRRNFLVSRLRSLVGEENLGSLMIFFFVERAMATRCCRRRRSFRGL